MANRTIKKLPARQIEKKRISVEHKANDNGEFVEITEQAGTYRDAIVIPLVGLHEVIEDLDAILRDTLVAIGQR